MIFIYYIEGIDNFMQKIIFGLKNLDKYTFKIIKHGLLFSLILVLFAISILLFYIFSGINFFYYIGLALTKLGFSTSVQVIICGIIVDYLKKQLFD